MELNEREYFDGFYTMPWEFGVGIVMVLTGPWQKKYRNILKSQKISALRLSDSAGWTTDDLSFISDLDFLRGLEIYNWDVKDISPIQNLDQLESIGLQCGLKCEIDFTVFSNLNNCYLSWKPKCDSLFSCSSLKSLNIENYPHKDFIPLKQLKKLEILKITSRKLEVLKGIEVLKEIENFDLYNCQQLLSLEGIENLKHLSTLQIDTCKKINDVKPVGTSKKLKNFYLDNCGKIQTLQPLKNCKELKKVFFIDSTNVEDGDLAFLFSLPNLGKVAFANRRHYSHKREDFVKTI